MLGMHLLCGDQSHSAEEGHLTQYVDLGEKKKAIFFIFIRSSILMRLKDEEGVGVGEWGRPSGSLTDQPKG